MPSTIERSPHPRLPATPEEPRRWVQVTKGLAALVGTVAVVVGVPVALLAAFGTPWPDEAPSVEWLSTPTTGETVLGVLAVVVWLAWLHFVLCLVVEAVAERRRNGLAPHVPGGGLGTQALARRLVATIVLLAATTGVGMSSATAVEADAPQQASSQLVEAAMPEVSVPDEMPEVSVPDEMPDGQLPSVDDLERATSLDVAEGVTTYYDVKPPHGRHYDTLWDIADRYLGDGRRYPEIWELNRGVTQPDGRVLEKADLIHPGWVMKLPNDAKGPGLKVVDHAELVAPTGSGGGGPDATGAVADETAEVAVADDGGTQDAALGGAWSPVFGVAGGLALAGAFLALRRRRASAPSTAWWTTRDPSGTDPHDPSPTPPTTPGSGLRGEADVDTASWLDRAVRSLGGLRGLPAPARASLGEGGLAVSFGAPPALDVPRGWVANGSVWTVDRDEQPEGSGPSPWPGLVSVGRRDDGTILLLDLESVPGLVSLDGDADVARGLALSVALDTATHAWADQRLVTLVGFADDLTAAGAGRLRHVDDLGRVLEGLDNVARHQRLACRDAGATSAREARATAPVGVEWTYHLVVCSGVPSADELGRLAALAADPAVALGVVVVGPVRDGEVRLTARPDGRVSSPLHGVDVVAQQVGVTAARGLAALMEPAAQSRRVTMDQLVDTLEAEQRVFSAHEATVDVTVLGPVTVSAPGEVEPERRGLLTELACFLALHPGGVHANRVSAAVWPRGVDDEVRASALRQLGTWLGATADGTPVLQHDAGIWQLAPGAVELDWATFRTSLNRAVEDGARRETHLRAALDLVTAPPFGDLPAGRYAWLETMTVEGDIAMAVNLTAQACAEAAAARDDEQAALAALRQGLRVLPASEELWRSRLRLAGHFGERADVEEVAREMYAAIAEHGQFGGSSAETDALVDELAPGFRSRVA